MNSYTDKTRTDKSRSVANFISNSQTGNRQEFSFTDNRAEAVQQSKLQNMATNNTHTAQLQEVESNSTQTDEDNSSGVENDVLNNLEVTYKDGSDGKEHRLYFEYVNGVPVLYRASTPMPFIAYLNKIDKNYKKWGKGFYANFEGVKYYYEDIDKLLRNYDDESIRKVNSLLVTIANVLKTTDYFKEKEGDDIKRERPGTNIQYLGFKPMQAANGENLDKMTLGVRAYPLTVKGQPGSRPAGWNTLGKKLWFKEPRANLRGHLLNHLLHGPGNDWNNIALITEDVNEATEASSAAPENVAKWEVIGSNHVLDYRVDVEYNRSGKYEGTYENYLPSRLVYTIKRKKLAEGRDGSSAGDWTEDAPSQPHYQSAYQWDIPYKVEKATIEPAGKYDKRNALNARIKNLRSMIGDAPRLTFLGGEINNLSLIKEVGAFVNAQSKIASELDKMEKGVEAGIDAEIKKRWPEGFLAKWKEVRFKEIGLRIDGSEDVNKQLPDIYSLLDENPLGDKYSNENMMWEAKDRCRLYLTPKEFPEWVLQDILKEAALAIEGLGDRIEMEKDSRMYDYE
ncbi:MAG: hypothetical protein FH748_11790 [Balneolaceae bacterium]|nr:hypothetical protein [Balneolaceae bacterium]